MLLTRLRTVPACFILACAGEPAAPVPPELTLETVATDLGFPLFLTAPPGETERLFVVEKGGWIRIVRNGRAEHPAFLDLQAKMATGGEQGLLGLAFHPDYEANGLFLVNYTDVNGATRISSFRRSADPDRADPTSERVLLTVPQPFELHNGGMILFHPLDRTVYIGFGDGGGEADPAGHGQNVATLHGSILRLELGSDGAFAIPGDNPFVGRSDARGEIWSYGLRNPWRFSIDRVTGDLFIGDVGETQREEINASAAADQAGRGANFGWRVMEGSQCFGTPTCDQAGLELPAVEYGHAEGCAVTGGYVYRGHAIPGLRGTYFYADFCAGWIRSFRLEGGAAHDHRDWPALAPGGRVTSFGEDAAGELYVLTAEGRVARIVEAP